jgi:two-component system cell cycle response regulator
MSIRSLFERGRQAQSLEARVEPDSARTMQIFLEAAVAMSPYGICCVSTDRRIVYWNQKAEEITGYLSHEAKGRFCYDHMLGHYDTNGSLICHVACPITETLHAGQGTRKRAFARHKEGHMLAIRLHTMPVRSETAEVIGVVEAFELDDDQSLGEFASCSQCGQTAVDKEMEIPEPISRAVTRIRSKAIAGLILVGLDNRQALANRYSQRASDQLLGLLGKTLNAALAKGGAAAQIDQDHFLLAFSMDNATELPEVSERVRRLVEGTTLQWWGSSLQLTASIGSATLSGTLSVQDAVLTVRQRLAAATQKGGNRVCCC